MKVRLDMSSIKDQIITKAKGLLITGEVAGVVGLRQTGEQIGPYVFTEPEQLDSLNLGDSAEPGDARYPLAKVLARVAQAHPADTFGIIVRGCDERALQVLAADGRINPLNLRRVRMIGFSCPEELAQKHECPKPWPDALVAGEQAKGVMPPVFGEEDPQAELAQWLAVFDRCVKCFGCRNICPVCQCKECTVEEEAFVQQRQLPIDPSFLMTRAVHMVDRCVYCGLCEEACPADIPLKQLYRLVSRLTGRRAGSGAITAKAC